jgi:hypothetical protein
MTATASTDVAPITRQPDEGEALWFLGILATIKASAETTGGQVAVIEHLAPRGRRVRDRDPWSARDPGLTAATRIRDDTHIDPSPGSTSCRQFVDATKFREVLLAHVAATKLH